MLMHIDPQFVACREVQRFLYDYVERELDERLLMAFDSHLLGCEGCQRIAYSYRKSTEAVRTHLAVNVALPVDLKARLVKELTQLTLS